MSDRMDGLMTVVSNVCLEMLNYCILKTGDVSNYPELSTYYQKSYFLTNATEEEKIDTAILYLTTISYSLPKK